MVPMTKKVVRDTRMPSTAEITIAAVASGVKLNPAARTASCMVKNRKACVAGHIKTGAC